MSGQQSFDESEWKNAFVKLLNDIPKKLYPNRHLEVEEKALVFIEELLFKLMKLVLEKNPYTVQDLEKIINSILPSPINEYAKERAKNVIHECLETVHHDSNLSLIQSSKKIVHLVSSSSISNQQPNVNLANCSLVLSPITKRIQQNYKLDIQTSIYLCALLEYIADDIFRLVGKYVENIGNDRIKAQDVRIALNADNLLMDLFYGDDYNADCDDQQISLMDEFSNLEFSNGETISGEGENANNIYGKAVKELIKKEREFLKELNLIIKVFREPFIRLLNASTSVPNTPNTPIIQQQNISPMNNQSISSLSSNTEQHYQSTSTVNTVFTYCSSVSGNYPNDEPIIKEEDIDLIFSNITDIYEFSINFLSLIEDTIEMNEESEGIGYCFQEMAESLEFDVFQSFVEDLFGRTKEEDKQHHHLKELFKNQKVVSCLSTSGKGVLLSIKYVLPKLLNGVIVHCFHYFEYIKHLSKFSPNEDDRESLRQCDGLLSLLKAFLDQVRVGRNFKLYEGYLKFSRTHSKIVKSKLEEMRKKIDGFNIPQYNQMCNEFIYEGVLSKARKGDKKGLKHIGENKTERYCFLFDGLLICCKKSVLHNNAYSNNATNFDFKKKEIYFIRNLEVCDSDSDPKAFELVHNAKDREHKEVFIFVAKSKEKKDIWISNLLLLIQKPILERTLDSILTEEKRRIPLKLPDPKQYRFAEKDSESNIMFDSSSGKDLIKAATLTKLIERLTYHQFADPKFVKTFLTTYRSFCEPETLLDLLIERFNIPFEENLTSVENGSLTREELKRFKKEYLEPIQLRVLNALKLWAESHYYDFTDEMKKKLNTFLEELQQKKQRKNLKKFVDNLIIKLEKKEKSNEEKKKKYVCVNRPNILYWYEVGRNEFNLLTVHPVEFARQLTLYEFDLYCAVNTFELVDAKWTKQDHKFSPNILKLTQHTDKFTYWIEKEIVECPNLEERQAMIVRLVEMLQVLYELNNFNGLCEIIGSIGRCSVHRLNSTFENLPPKSARFIEAMTELLDQYHPQRYQEHLRSINPPCVPFLGYYQTLITKLEEGNKDFIQVNNDTQLIHFSKRRKIAEITSEIQQYQNQPYCLDVYPELRDFIANLDPLEGRTTKEFGDYTFARSEKIEPKNVPTKNLPRGERKYKDVPLKSPGIKPSSSSTASSHHSFSSNNSTIVSNHQPGTGSMSKNDGNSTNFNQQSNPQTPNRTPSSSTPTSPTQFHQPSSNQLSPRSPGFSDNFSNKPVMTPTLANGNLSSHQSFHQFTSNSITQFRFPTTPILNPNFAPNINTNGPFVNNGPPPLPPRRTPSQSPSPNFALQLSSSPNQNVFQFPNASIAQIQAPPLPPRRTPSQSPSPFPKSLNSPIIESSVESLVHDMPPPLPPKIKRNT